MRILLAHNFYQSGAPSGEDVVFSNEIALLRQGRHEVILYERHNDQISESLLDRVDTAFQAVWSSQSYRELRALIRKHRPDVAHFHNTFPLLSPSAYKACRDEGVPVVQTLHNYRLICPGALLLRDGRPCEDCIGGSLLPSIRHACYRNSRAATTTVATVLSAHRLHGTYQRYVDRYIALTGFARQRFIRGGLPADRIMVKPNCLVDPPSPGMGGGDYVLYVGRLTAEKGVETLIRAWNGLSIPLKVAGDGALRPRLEQLARESKANVEFLGYRSRAEVHALMQSARLLVIPSECYEGFPMTVLEALSTGTPMVVSAIGALDEIVRAPDHGLKFDAGNAQTLRDAVMKLYCDADMLRTIRLRNRLTFDELYAPRQALASLESIYGLFLEKRPLKVI